MCRNPKHGLRYVNSTVLLIYFPVLGKIYVQVYFQKQSLTSAAFLPDD